MKPNTKVTIPKPSKKAINEVITAGLDAQGKLDSISGTIKADLFNRDKKTNQSQLTKRFDEIMNGKDESKKQNLKRFVRQQFQTMVKDKQVQLAVLLDDTKNQKVTVKMVNKPMVENSDGKYIDQFSKDDLGSYRVVRTHSQTPELTLAEELAKWMRSQKKNGLFDGSRADKDDVSKYDFQAVIATAEIILRDNEI